MEDEKVLRVRTPVKSLVLRLNSMPRYKNDPEEIAATLYQKGKSASSTNLAFTYGPVTRCYLRIKVDGSVSLWINGTAFDVHPSGANTIAATFGIRIENEAEKASS